MADSLGKKALKGTVWATADRFGGMVLQFVVNLVLANLLLPSDFGTVGVLAIFIAVSQTVIDGGFASALIQRKEPTDIDYSTIFFWNLGFSLLLYGVLFVASPFIAGYFSMPVLRDVLRVISLNLVISALAQMQLVRMKRELAFKRLAVVNLTSYIVASVIAIVMAFRGFGVWSLVAMTVINQAMVTGLYWILNRWHPVAVFSMKSFRSLFGFGGYLLAASILHEICRNLQGVIIGKRFSAADMGYYSQAYKLDQVTSYSIPQVLVQVLFPVFSNIQNDRERLVEMTLLGMRVIAAVVFPLLIVLMIVAEPLVVTLYRDVWLPCVPYFRILCVGGIFVSLQNVNFYAVAALGHSDVLFRWSFYKWGLLLVLLLVGMFFGMEGIMWAIVVSNLNIFVVNAVLSRRYVGCPLRRQIRCVLPPLATGAAAGLAVVPFMGMLPWWVCASAYLLLYVALALLFRLRALGDLRQLLQLVKKK